MKEERKMAIASMVLKRTNQRIIATVPLDELENLRRVTDLTLINPVEYAFIRNSEGKIIVDFAPYVIGYTTTSVPIGKDDILTIYPADEETSKAYFANATPLYAPLPAEQEKEVEPEKPKDNISLFKPTMH